MLRGLDVTTSQYYHKRVRHHISNQNFKALKICVISLIYPILYSFIVDIELITQTKTQQSLFQIRVSNVLNMIQIIRSHPRSTKLNQTMIPFVRKSGVATKVTACHCSKATRVRQDIFIQKFKTLGICVISLMYQTLNH